MKKLLLVALSTFACSAHAWEPKFYAGASLSTWGINLHTVNAELHLQTLEITGGAVLLPYISLEGRAGGGFTNARDYSANEDVSLDYYTSAYFRPFLANETATLYGLLGGTTLQLNRKGASSSTTDASYGVGVTFTTSPHTQFVAEWKKLVNAEDFDISGGTVGFTYQF
jgi:outer membrane autotransporter protein